jgi:hypothetical protein
VQTDSLHRLVWLVLFERDNLISLNPDCADFIAVANAHQLR